MSYTALIFDLDGTLVRTKLEYVYSIANQVFREIGFPQYIGIPNVIESIWYDGRRKDIIKNLDMDPDRFFYLWKTHDRPEKRKIFLEPYEDIGYLKTAKERGYKMGIVSTTFGEMAKMSIEVIEEVIGDGLFDAVIALWDSKIKDKPHPDGIIKCLEKMKVRNKEAVFIGNGAEDVIAAQHAGVFDVLIDRDEYKSQKCNPSKIIKSLYEIDDIIGKKSRRTYLQII